MNEFRKDRMKRWLKMALPHLLAKKVVIGQDFVVVTFPYIYFVYYLVL